MLFLKHIKNKLDGWFKIVLRFASNINAVKINLTLRLIYILRDLPKPILLYCLKHFTEYTSSPTLTTVHLVNCH